MNDRAWGGENTRIGAAVYHLVHRSDCAWSWQQHTDIAGRLVAIVSDCTANPVSTM